MDAYREGEMKLIENGNKKAIIAITCLFMLTTSGCGRSAVITEQPNAQQTIDIEDAIVSYLGPEGTYTQEACGVFFGNDGTYEPYSTVSDAVDALEAGAADYSVIPQENTIGGAVTDYVDIVLAHEDLSVVGEVELPINQNLLAIPGTELSEIKTVYSHKQGIAQGKDWLSSNLPGAEIVEVSSTAEGAKMVSESGDKTCAAIASAACVEVYGLEMIAEAIQGNESNKTRFYVLSKDTPVVAQAQRLAFVASGSAKDFPSLMKEIKEQKMTLISVHDRPMKTELGEYRYLVECTDCNYQNYLNLEKKCAMNLRYLGSFDVH